MGFRNFGTATPAAAQGPCAYPAFDENGQAMPGVLAAASNTCVVDYLSGPGPIGHVHPSGGYRRSVVLELYAVGIDIRAMAVGETRTVLGHPEACRATASRHASLIRPMSTPAWQWEEAGHVGP